MKKDVPIVEPEKCTVGLEELASNKARDAMEKPIVLMEVTRKIAVSKKHILIKKTYEIFLIKKM